MFKNRINIHCTAGFGNVESIERFWKEDLKWKHKGYAVIIDLDGKIYYLHDNSAINGYKTTYTDDCWKFTTNGISGYNKNSIHIAYIGGVENVGGKWVAKDTRTEEQKQALHEVIQEAISFLQKQNIDVSQNFGVYGHREYSSDKDGDGVISKWERIKECPSFSVMESIYHTLYSSKDRYYKLPYAK